ncbi:hypothetical protein [Amycolatopsis anabasis]|uniref:hypothetical protein n=1 Tax=Amycolatopsis anabasis TaxID=1840409 RepID=UPI001FEB0564|nr:hypothetical protein [Amycolatopsis anabasis]
MEEFKVWLDGERSELVFTPAPGECGGRLDPGQTLIADDLARQIDFHVWPSVSPWAISRQARTVCAHIDYESIHHGQPELFERRKQFGAPALADIWEAKHQLAGLGYPLCLDMELEDIDGELALVLCGAGVVGHLSDEAWEVAAALLTTDWSEVIEPDPNLEDGDQLERPARPPTSVGKRSLPVRVTPLGWQVGDWVHTWWSYPLIGPPDSGAHSVTIARRS